MNRSNSNAAQTVPRGVRAEALAQGWGNSGPQSYREIISDRQLRVDAKMELGRVGMNIEPPETSDQAVLRRHRADCRRAANAIRGTIDPNKPETLSDSKINAIDWLHAQIDMISNELDDSEADNSGRRSKGRAGTPMLNRDGQRVGTILSSATLKDQDAIANALGASNSDDGEMSLSNFVRGVAGMRCPESVRNALSEGTNTAGGFTVPTVLLPGILQALVPNSSLLQAGANVTVLDQGATQYNFAAVDAIPTPGWRSELGPVVESENTFRNIPIKPQSLAFKFKVSRELLADSAEIEQALQTAIAAAMAKEMDRAGLRGTGTAPEIRGLLNIANVNAIGSGANGATPTNYSLLIQAWREIVSDNAPAPTAAIMHPRDMATFAGLNDAQGQPLRKPELLNSIAMYQTSQIPTNLTVGTSTNCSEIYVGDFSQFYFFMREVLTIQLAREVEANTGAVVFYCHSRVDAAAMYAQAFGVITGVRG